MSSAPHKEKRQILRGISQLAKELQESEMQEFTINEILIEHFYKTEIHQTFETLFNWNKKGFKVKKGETAFLIWGTPRKISKEAEKKEKKEEDESEFFPLCYLFSNAQVIEKDA